MENVHLSFFPGLADGRLYVNNRVFFDIVWRVDIGFQRAYVICKRETI